MKLTAAQREERARIIAQARALLAKADTEKRALTDEERAKYDELMKTQAALKADIEARELLEAAEREAAGTELRNDPAPATETVEELRMLGFRSWIQNQAQGLRSDAKGSGSSVICRRTRMPWAAISSSRSSS